MISYTPNEIELLFLQALGLIVAACFFTPLLKRSGMGAVLGYLIAGVVVNIIFAGSFSHHAHELLHFSEFGVVLFLFVIGLELKPSSLWSMRVDIFGLGLSQMLICGALLSLGALLFTQDISAVVIIGLGLALSSTAIVMSLLEEKKERNSLHGKKIFGILLFQDLAIVPLLLLVTVLTPNENATIDVRQSLFSAVFGVGCILALILAGRYALNGLFSVLSKANLPEIMTASALGVVIAAALLMDIAGMSYAMGAFIAGVMLAESSYRHEIEANIEPFRGLFLGLFFMAIGLSLDLQVIKESWLQILIMAPIVMLMKAVAIYVLCRLFNNTHHNSLRVALGLSQHGEFGFVLFSAAAVSGILSAELTSTLIAVISVSMALTSVAGKLESVLISEKSALTMREDYSNAKNNILIIGFGRFGQVVSQALYANGTNITILDNDPNRIVDARRFGLKVHYGDGTRRDILRAAGLGKVHTVAVCTDNPETTNMAVSLVKRENPSVKVFARSFDRIHSIHLHSLKVNYSVRETFESALAMGRELIVTLGASDKHTDDIIADIRQRDASRLAQQIIEGELAGSDKLHVKPIHPENLTAN